MQNLISVPVPMTSCRQEAYLQRLRRQFPFVYIRPLTRTAFGRRVWALQLGGGSRKVLVAAGHHANECITSDALWQWLFAYCEALLDGGALDGVPARELYHDTMVYLVPLTNPDGADLAAGVCAISAGAMLVVALLVADFMSAVMLAAIVGACVGFIPYNFNPAKIFMGDTGSTFLGFMLSTISIYGLFKMYAIISFAVPFLVLGLPIFDICFAVVRRVSKGQSPMHADRGHVHHRLIDMGFSQKQAVAIAYMLSAILGMAAVVLTNDGETQTLIFLAAVVVVGGIGFWIIFGHRHKDAQKHKEDSEDHYEKD